MNINIEPFYCFVKREHFFAYESNFGEHEWCCAFAARSVSGRSLLFHCMTESGMQRANVPISAMVHEKSAPAIDLDMLQLWNCFGNEVTVCKFDYLEGWRCQVILKDKTMHWGTYMMTFDWEKNAYTLTPQDYKNAHLIKLDNGCFALQPNNRILWRDSNFITKPFDKSSLPKYKVDKHIFVCERSDRWTSEHTDCFYYGMVDGSAKSD